MKLGKLFSRVFLESKIHMIHVIISIELITNNSAPCTQSRLVEGLGRYESSESTCCTNDALVCVALEAKAQFSG